MPIRVTCPNCRRSFTFADAAAGRATACQACGTPLTIAPPAPAGGASAWGSASGGNPVGPAPQVQPGYVPTAGMPTVGMPYGTAPYGSPANVGGVPGPRSADPGQFGLPSDAGCPQGAPPPHDPGLPDLGLPPLGGGGGLGGPGLPSLPAAGMGRAYGPDPRFAQLPAGPVWYANPWVWTGGGLGLGAILGLAALVLTAPKSKVRRPAGSAAATTSPVPPPPGRGFERPGMRVPTTPGPATPGPAGTEAASSDSATPPAGDPSIDSVLGGAKEIPSTPSPPSDPDAPK